MKKFFVILLCLLPFVISAKDAEKEVLKVESAKESAEKSDDSEVSTPAQPSNDATKKDLEELKKSMESLKKQSEEQQKLLLQLKEMNDKSQKEVEILKKGRELDAKQAAEKAEKEKKQGAKKEKKVVFTPYGRVELRGWANDAQFLANDLPIYVLDQNASSASISVRDTRLGLKIAFPGIKSAKLFAHFEFDLYGNMANGGMAEVINTPRLRHGYLGISKRFKTGTTIGAKFGQTWSVATITLFPILGSGGWGAGNLWQRLPQADLYIEQELGGDWKMHFSAAVAKPMSGMSPNRSTYIEVNIDSSSASHWPSLQSQLSFGGSAGQFKLFFAAAGSYHRENYENGVLINNITSSTKLYGKEVEAWSFDSGLKIFHKYGYVQGKFFIGNNLDTYGAFSGGQTYSVAADGTKSVIGSQRVMGYWGELHLTPFKALDLFTGVGGEKPDIEQTGSMTTFEENTAFWVGASYTFFDRLMFRFYWHQIQTEGALGKNAAGDVVRKDKTGNAYTALVRFSF
ncbi:hypothetical protein KAH37_05240 [bacterium]|nr:hypothetical protein [bacterium]